MFAFFNSISAILPLFSLHSYSTLFIAVATVTLAVVAVTAAAACVLAL